MHFRPFLMLIRFEERAKSQKLRWRFFKSCKHFHNSRVTRDPRFDLRFQRALSLLMKSNNFEYFLTFLHIYIIFLYHKLCFRIENKTYPSMYQRLSGLEIIPINPAIQFTPEMASVFLTKIRSETAKDEEREFSPKRKFFNETI